MGDAAKTACEKTVAKLRASAATQNTSLRERFRIVRASVSCTLGSPWALAVALGLVIVWAASGQCFDYSDGWQLVINMGITIVRFLMAFLIQATQLRESKSLHLKINQLLRAAHGARTAFVNIDDVPDDTLHELPAELGR